jgi:exodeoxyribonuclease VII large subunit
MPISEEKVYTITAITRAIKYTLEESFPAVWVEGEISNYLHHSSGHRYLSLKDENATIKLTIWRSVGAGLQFEPENGMKVRAFGDIAVYEKGGNYQLNVRKLVPVGVGPLEIAFRQLYEKLSIEGLFDESRKKQLPEYPLKIGLVTSPTGAAIRDIIHIARRRNPSIRLILFPAQVQGKGAENTIIAGIEYFNSREDIDVIITGRGGGSLEDLWCFNEESLVRAIASSKKPVVTGIGHEIDTTLADLAADLRAPTPSAAAEIVIWEKRALQSDIAGYLSQMEFLLSGIVEQNGRSLYQLKSRPVYLRPETLIREREQYLDGLKRQFAMAGKIILEKQRNALSLVVSRLESLSPLAILSRGYAVIKMHPSGVPVKSIVELKRDDRIEAILKDGSALASIEDIRRTEQKK